MVAGGFIVDELDSIDAKEIEQSASGYDLVLAAASVESRCTQIPRLLRTSDGVKLAFSLSTPSLPVEVAAVADKNKRQLVASGFLIEEYSQERAIAVIRGFQAGPSGNLPETRRVFIDVTCLPRRALADVLCELASSIALEQKIELTLGYTLARYTPPPAHPLPANKRVAPVHSMLAGWTNKSGLPVTAVVGLGYEKGKALGAVEYLQANDSFLFLPSSPELRYRPKVERHNRALIKPVRPHQMVNYDVIRPVQTLLTMDSLVAGIKRTAKPILLPFGPKIFFALSVLVAFAHREAAVWYVSGEENEPPVDRPATAYSFALCCELSRKADEAAC